MNAVSLFSGIGGLDLALRGYAHTRLYCETDGRCAAVLRARMDSGDLPHGPIHDDVQTLDAATIGRLLPGVTVDLVTAGFPCTLSPLPSSPHGPQGRVRLADRRRWKQARTSALQGLDEAWTEAAPAYSGMSFAWSRSSRRNLGTSSWRTSQGSGPSLSSTSAPLWPAQGMIVDGRLYESAPLADTIDVTDGSASPAAEDRWLWPTPRASQDSLAVCQMFQNLLGASHSRLYAGWCVGSKKRRDCGHVSPTWLEWLMGFPRGWTSPRCGATTCWGTPSAPSRPGSHSRSWPASAATRQSPDGGASCTALAAGTLAAGGRPTRTSPACCGLSSPRSATGPRTSPGTSRRAKRTRTSPGSSGPSPWADQHPDATRDLLARRPDRTAFFWPRPDGVLCPASSTSA